MPLVVVRLADHHPAVRQLQVTLGALQRLDRRLLIDRQHHGVVARHYVKTNDVRRLRHELLIHDDYICVDIRTNLGLKSRLLSQHVPSGRVIAVEAAPTVAQLLEQNIANNSAKGIIVVKSAIGDSDGRTHFAENSAYGYISPDGVEVPVQTLSSLVAALNLERLDFVKIDVEGYEFPILRTSIELLNQHRSLAPLEFNTWCQVALFGVHPKKFIDLTLSQFTHVYAVPRNAGDNYLERVPEDGARTFLHNNIVHDARSRTSSSQIMRRDYSPLCTDCGGS